MSRVSKILLKQLPEKHILSIRKNIDFFNEYSDFMESSLKEIGTLIEEIGLLPSSGPIVCFHNMELENLDVEAGYEIAVQTESKDNIIAQTIPSCTVVMAIDRGSYERQDPTLEDIMKWISENGFTSVGGIYYHYLNGEEQPQSEYLTEMYIPVKRK